MTQFIPSPEQSKIKHFVDTETGNLAISALAGCGKTSTLVWIAKHLPASASKIFCAFNADIVKELEAKLTGTGVTARTFHSLGLAALKKYVNATELKPKENKYRDLVNKWAESDSVLSLTLSEVVQYYKAEERADKLYQLRKDTLTLFVNLLNLTRVKLVEWNDADGLTRLVYMNRLDVEVPHEELVDLVIRNVEYIMKQAEAETRKHNIDFTDMIYWAVRWNLNLYPYKYVLVDEAQDFNPMQREMIDKIIDPKGGRIILVGDPNQAIYAFAGADSDSFDLSVKRWNCTVLPLNTTRRCASVITQHAARLVPSFTCPPDKPRGKLVWLDESFFESSVQLGDMVVSRVQAPLVKYCLALIAKGIPSVIKGKDMSKGFIALLDKLAKRRDYSFANLLKCLDAYEAENIETATKKNDDAAIEVIRDQCSGLRFFIEAYPDVASITDLENKIKNLFGDSKPNSDVVTFCTVHKSKGLEADRVFILAPDKMPLKSKDMTSEQLQQEWNLLYVAETRAKSVLVVMTTPKFLKTNTMPHYAQEDFEEHNWDALLDADVEAEPVIEAKLNDTPDDSQFDEFILFMRSNIHATGNHYSGMFTEVNGYKFFAYSKDGYMMQNTQNLAINRFDSVDNLTQKMWEIEPNITRWFPVLFDEWQTVIKLTPHNPAPVVDAVFKPGGMFIEAFSTPVTEPDAPQPESAGFINSVVHRAMETLKANEGMYATVNHVKMFVTPFEGRYVVKTIFVNGDENNPVDTIQEALTLMFEFQPDPNQWEVLSLAEWAEKRNPTPVVEASEPPSFAKTMHQRLTDINANYDPDKGLFADGETTTMYITTDIEDNFVVYERDYANEPEMAWSRDYKTTNIVTLISKMQAINPDATQWTMTAWGEWIDRLHEDEPADMDALKEEFVDAIRDMVTQMGGVIAGESTSVTLGDQTYELVQMPTDSGDSPQPETPNADALTISMIAKTLINDQFTQQQAHELASEIHAEVKPLLSFTDWTSAHIATIKVAIKRLLRKANHLGYIEAIANAIAHFYQHGTLPLNPVLGQISEYQAWQQEQIITKAEETGAVMDAILTEPEPTDTPIEAPQPVADVVTTPVTPPADDSTFFNGESTPSYTNGKDHSASTTPPPAHLPATAPDVLKSLIDQFRPLDLPEITLMIQALEHVRKEKTEGVNA